MAKSKTSKPKAKKVAKVVKAAADHKNGVKRPGADTKCAAVWDACAKLIAGEKELTFDALREAVDSKIADATIMTQRQRFRTFNAK